MAQNMDEFLAQMELDEAADAPLISPVNYAKVRPITPQLVYYGIRTKKLKIYICNCGGRRISMEEADDYFRERRGSTAWPWGKERDGQDAEPAAPAEHAEDTWSDDGTATSR
jgi:hypothetical protein